MYKYIKTHDLKFSLRHTNMHNQNSEWCDQIMLTMCWPSSRHDYKFLKIKLEHVIFFINLTLRSLWITKWYPYVTHKHALLEIKLSITIHPQIHQIWIAIDKLVWMSKNCLQSIFLRVHHPWQCHVSNLVYVSIHQRWCQRIDEDIQERDL